METTITMTPDEQHRARMLAKVAGGGLTIAEASVRLGLSVRQVWRLAAAFERDGPAGLVHGNRGRVSPRRIDEDVRARVLELRRTTFADVNDTHFTELLLEREGISLCRASVRAILRADGIGSPRRRRPPRHRSRRPRMPAEGVLHQLDASPHRWLGEAGPELSLLGAIDDATGKVGAACFREHEDAAGYFLLLRDVILGHGVPDAVYHDRHSVFAPTRRGATRDPDAAPDALSQFGRALAELGITSIAARSPQAKGRVERLWGTFQDRLVVELRLAGITDIAAANGFLAAYLERHNARFAVPAADPVPAWLALPADARLERILVFKYRRKVAKDHTVQLRGRVLQLARSSRAYAGRRVEVHVRLDGSTVAFDGERELAALAAPPDPVSLRPDRHQRPEPSLTPAPSSLPWQPPREHPWRAIRRDSKLYQRLTDSPGS
jgi:transposase